MYINAVRSVSTVSIGIFVISMYMYAVRFMFVRFDIYTRNFDVYVCSSIYVCAVRCIYV